MGVVFQAAHTREGQLVHYPAMKVVLTPIAETMEKGVLTEAGYEFFSNILTVQPVIRSDNGTDRNTTEG